MGINGDCLLFRINLSFSVSFSASVIHSELNCCAVGAILLYFLLASRTNLIRELTFAFAQMLFASLLKYSDYAMSSWRQAIVLLLWRHMFESRFLPELLKRKHIRLFWENRQFPAWNETNPWQIFQVFWVKFLTAFPWFHLIFSSKIEE